MFLADFSVIKPDIGLIFWTTIIFLALWAILGRLAFKPIAKALKDREHSIDDALKQADKAREEMQSLKAENDKIIAEAREERSRILKEAKEMSSNIVKEAQDKAKSEGAKIIENARVEIENQKNAALAEVKTTASMLALKVAERIIREKLEGDPAQEAFAKKLVEEIELN